MLALPQGMGYNNRMRTVILVAIVTLIFTVLLLGLFEFSDEQPAPEKPVTDQQEVESFSLSNGMEVVLVRNDRVPAISHTLWMRVGAADDPAGRSGLAHYVEHMMFKATRQYAAGEFEQQITELGGELNAFTGRDFTGYYVNIASEHLERVMQLESQRLQHLKPSAEAFEKELQVILEERRSRVDNRPAALLDEAMRAALFRHHPYRIPIIGWMHEIETLSAEDVRAFYDSYYHPGMMVLVVVGDITRERLEPLAERYYGTIPSRQPLARQWVNEPPQRTARRVALAHELVKQPRLTRYYAAPSYAYGDAQHALPLEVLSYWLGGGRTSLLYRELVVEQQLATSVNAYYSGLSRGPAVLTVRATPVDGVSLKKLETAMDEVIARTRRERIDSASLARAKTLLKADAVYARDGLQGIARYIGHLRMLDLALDYYTDWEERVEAVSAEQVQTAARAVLQPARSVTGSLRPQAVSPPARLSDDPTAQSTAQEEADAPAVP